MKSLFLLLLLSVPAFGQKLLEPIRISLTARQPDCTEFTQAFNDELRRLNDVAIVRSKPEFEVHIASAELRDDSDAIFGYVATLLVIKGKDKFHSIYSGRDAALLGRRVVGELDKAFFQPRRKETK